MKIDVHTHILPESWPDLNRRFDTDRFVTLERVDDCTARMLRADGSLFREVKDNLWDAERRLEECDRTGVGVQVLSTVPVMFAYHAPGEQALELARILNDHIADVVRAYPERFVGLGTVPLQDPDLAAAELTRCVRDLGLAGIEIGSHVGAWNLSEPALFEVFQTVRDLEAALFVHPWDMMGTDTMSRYWLPWLVGMPAETSRAICSVIFGGVLERLPGLRILFAHGGGSFPATLGRIEHGFHVRPDLCAVDNPRSPREYLDRFYVDSLVHDEAALRYLLDLLGPDRIALGSDYPFPLGEERPGALIETLADLSPDVRARLTGGTALAFLGRAADRFRG